MSGNEVISLSGSSTTNTLSDAVRFSTFFAGELVSVGWIEEAGESALENGRLCFAGVYGGVAGELCAAWRLVCEAKPKFG